VVQVVKEAIKLELGNLPKSIQTEVFSLKRDRDIERKASKISDYIERRLISDLGDALEKYGVELNQTYFETLFENLCQALEETILFFLKLKEEETLVKGREGKEYVLGVIPSVDLGSE